MRFVAKVCVRPKTTQACQRRAFARRNCPPVRWPNTAACATAALQLRSTGNLGILNSSDVTGKA